MTEIKVVEMKFSLKRNSRSTKSTSGYLTFVHNSKAKPKNLLKSQY